MYEKERKTVQLLLRLLGTLVSILLLFTLSRASDAQNQPIAQEGLVTEWLVCGPFPTEPDMFYIDYLEGAGGEENIRPQQASVIKRPDGRKECTVERAHH